VVVQQRRLKVSSRVEAVEHLLGNLWSDNRAELEGIEVITRLLGPVPQVAVFDTGFHRKMPLAAAVYPRPYDWFAGGIRRYGFHGINHQYCANAPRTFFTGASHRSDW
jgi:acetate kinase